MIENVEVFSCKLGHSTYAKKWYLIKIVHAYEQSRIGNEWIWMFIKLFVSKNEKAYEC